MQDYIELRVTSNPCTETITDLLADYLGEIGFESFVPDTTGLTAYIQKNEFDNVTLETVLSDFPIETVFEWSVELVEGRDWNEEWEKNYFKPIVIGNEVVVHSSFHTDVPVAAHDIIIDPKMAFGTGHHATTSQMMRHILSIDLAGKSVIDMGTGTGILAILSKMRGAGKVTGIEIDPFACENTVENVRLNNVEVQVICGDASALSHLTEADLFLANINRNVITADIAEYSDKLRIGGIMLLSGFYEEDIPVVLKAASQFGLELIEKKIEDNWVAIKLMKTK